MASFFDVGSKLFIGVMTVLISALVYVGNRQKEKNDSDLRRIEVDARSQQEKNELRLREIDVGARYLPQLFSANPSDRWSTLSYMYTLNNVIATKLAIKFLVELIKRDNRQQIQDLEVHADPVLSHLVKKLRPYLVQPDEVLDQMLLEIFSLETVEEILRVLARRPVPQAPLPQALSPDQLLQMVQIRRPSESVDYKDTRNETYGRFIGTRAEHLLDLPEEFAIGRYLITNATFLEFVEDDGYRRDDFWDGAHYADFRCGDGVTRGPASWPSDRGPGTGLQHHPVTGISFVEARAFCRWLQATKPDLLEGRGWRWELPKEDMWEYVARTGKGLRYPWGNEFKPDHCNSAEQKLGATSEVNQFPQGRSKVPDDPDVEGCYDMAGNVWEFVLAQDTHWGFCVLRGGSYRNTQNVVRSYLRLHGVPSNHRAPDFGFRCAQYPEGEVGCREPKRPDEMARTELVQPHPSGES